MVLRVRVHEDGRHEFYNFKDSTKVNESVWLLAGDKYTKLGEGRYEEFYLDEIVDGKYVVDNEASASASLAKYKAEAKAAIEKAIAIMRVEVDGLGYDGDETATTRMQKAITTLVGDEEINWRLYDNSMAVVTQTELGKAMRAAGVLMSKLWFCASVEEVEAIVGLDPIWLDKYKAQ